ncbi:MAG: TetR/AcrR family transcriptional regulator [Ramlibacter sp.]|jgi:AcrR family transcriptional regulator|nr:TetR/AcrR family transcriptional regulator [Ramlibacter sp.]
MPLPRSLPFGQNSTIVRFIPATMSVTSLPLKPPGPPREGRALQKGQQTKAAIVEAALGLATQIGIEGLSIGALAEVAQMSKSGVFAHFGSREELQISVVREYHRRFEEEVFYPAMKEARGLPRLRALFSNWMKRTSLEIDSGCLYISGAVEFDDRPGPVRDALMGSVKSWLEAMHRAVIQAKEEGHLRADIDEQQLAFEIHGLVLALHYEARFLKNPGSVARANAGFDHILKFYGAKAPGARPAKPTRSPRQAKD